MGNLYQTVRTQSLVQFSFYEMKQLYLELGPRQGQKGFVDPGMGATLDSFDLTAFLKEMYSMDDGELEEIQTRTVAWLKDVEISLEGSGWETPARAQAERLMLNNPGIFYTIDAVDTGDSNWNKILSGPANLVNLVGSTLNGLADVAIGLNDGADAFWDVTGRHLTGLSLSDTMLALSSVPPSGPPPWALGICVGEAVDDVILMAKKALKYLEEVKNSRLKNIAGLDKTLAEAIAIKGDAIAKAAGSNRWQREQLDQIRGFFLQKEAVFDQPLRWITQEQHMVPDSEINKLKNQIRWAQASGDMDDVKRMEELLAKVNEKNMASIHGDFHQRFVHGNGLELKNAGDGGIWNGWWEDKLQKRPLSFYNVDQVLEWQQESYGELQRMWNQYKEMTGKTK